MQEEKEIWKPVVGYEGYYEVSSFGNVRSIDRIVINSNGISAFYKGFRLKQLDKRGYRAVSLSIGNIRKQKLVHRLVAEAFIPNPNHLPHINHKDEIPSNNFVGNLEWCTPLYNDNYGNRNQKVILTKISLGMYKSVLKLDTLGNILKKYDTITDVKKDGYNRQNVEACCRFKRFSANGFLWVFVSDYEKIDMVVSRFKTKKPKNEMKKIIQINPNGDILNKFNSIKEASESLNIPRYIISNRCTGKAYSLINGYTFKYAE